MVALYILINFPDLPAVCPGSPCVYECVRSASSVVAFMASRHFGFIVRRTFGWVDRVSQDQ